MERNQIKRLCKQHGINGENWSNEHTGKSNSVLLENTQVGIVGEYTREYCWSIEQVVFCGATPVGIDGDAPCGVIWGINQVIYFGDTPSGIIGGYTR